MKKNTIAAFLLLTALTLMAFAMTRGYTSDIPMTGDNSHIFLWVGVAGVTFLALILLLVTGKKKKK